MEKICLVRKPVDNYPRLEIIGRPSVKYPEYPFTDISDEIGRAHV